MSANNETTFENGLRIEWASFIKSRKGEDDCVISEDVSKTMREYSQNCPNCYQQLKTLDFANMAEVIERALGKVAIFAVLDGHQMPAKPHFHDSLVIVFAQTLVEVIGAAQGELEKLKGVGEACYQFPKNLHLAFRDDQKVKSYPSPGGATLSFIVITEEHTITGVLGDSPTGVVKLDGFTESVEMHDNDKICRKELSHPARFTAGNQCGNYYIGLPYCSGEILMHNGVGDCCFDADFQEAFWELQNYNPPKPQSEEAEQEQSEKPQKPLTRTKDELRSFLGAFYDFFGGRFRDNSFNFKFSHSLTKPDPKEQFVFNRIPHLKSFCNKNLLASVCVTDGVDKTFSSFGAFKDMISVLKGGNSIKAALKALSDSCRYSGHDDASAICVKYVHASPTITTD